MEKEEYAYKVYALNVRKINGGFLYQVNCFETLEEVEAEKETLSLKSDEEISVLCIKYDENGNEISVDTIE